MQQLLQVLYNNPAESPVNLHKHNNNWQKVLKVAMGGFSCYEVKGEIWDPNERDLAVINKTYSQLRPTLDMSWNAFLRGLFSKEEPFSDQTQ